MKREYPGIGELKREFGRRKTIPRKYEHVILKALSHYPELRETAIEFRLKNDHPITHQTIPSLGSLLKFQYKYVVILLEEAQPPVEQALFRNLPESAQLGVIGHELGHILQYTTQDKVTRMKRIFTNGGSTKERSRERGADIIAVEHGLGFELYTHAVFIRSVPGYIDLRKDIEICHLHPHEILEALPPEQIHEINTQS